MAYRSWASNLSSRGEHPSPKAMMRSVDSRRTLISRLSPPRGHDVKTGKNQDKAAHCKSRKDFYDWLAATICIDGIVSVERDTEFDDPGRYHSGGIRLRYKSTTEAVPGLKEGILLEGGFDDVTPNTPKTISSWAYDYAAGRGAIIHNRAIGVACYGPGYTFVGK